MKKLILIFTLALNVLFTFKISAQGWVAQLTNAPNGFTAVNFTDNQNGWAVGFLGMAYKTTNGANWNPMPIQGATNNLQDVFFYDNNNGWVCGDGHLIFYTTNGGTSWTQATTPTGTTSISDIIFSSPTVGYASTENKLYKSINGGATWTLHYSFPTSQTIQDINIYLSDLYVVAGQNYHKFTDGGTTWTSTPISSSSFPVDMKFIDNFSSLIVATGEIQVQATIGNPNTYISFANPSSNFTLSADGYDEDNQIVVGFTGNGKGIVFRWDGNIPGFKRDSIYSPCTQLNECSFKGANQAWAVGQNITQGVILKYDPTYSPSSAPATQPILSGPTTKCSGDASLKWYKVTSGSLNGNTQWAWYVSNIAVGTGDSILLNTNLPVQARGEGGTVGNGPFGTFNSTIITSPSANITTEVLTTCGLANGALKVSSSKTNVTYQWTDGFGVGLGSDSIIRNLRPSASYFVTVTDINGCSVSAFGVTNASSPAPLPSYGEYSSPKRLEFINGSSYASIQWYRNNTPISSPYKDTLLITLNGDYFAIGTTAAGCLSDTGDIFTFTGLATSIKQIEENSSLSVSPNPAKNILYLHAGENIESVEIVNLIGATLIAETKKENYNSIDISGLSTGVYILKANTEKGIAIKRFIKE